MVTIYFPDGTYKNVRATEADHLIKLGEASIAPYKIEDIDTIVLEKEDEPEVDEGYKWD